MTTNEIAVPAAAAQPDRLGQATAVEQSRAVAEVQGAILVAQRCPRNVPGAVAEMEQSCAQKGLADKAFFSVPRAGSTVNGPSVHLARELARVWGNVQYGVSEMRRDDGAGQSEMKAFAWDVQTNTRVETTFVVPHMRDTKGGAKKLTSMDDIYNSNANAGARRVRECIFSILPPWFVETAKENCQKTLEHGGGIPLPKRISAIIKAFDELDVTADQLEQRVGKPNAKWTARDVAQLTTVGSSLRHGEIQKDEAFPPMRLTADDLGGPAPDTKAATNGASSDAVQMISQPQSTRLHASLNSCGITKRPEVLAVLSKAVGRTLSSSSELTAAEAAQLLDDLGRCVADENPGAALDAWLTNFEGASA